MTGLAHQPRIAEAIVAIAAAMGMLYFLQGVLIPLVLAFVLAVLVDALVRFVADHVGKIPKVAILTIVTATVLACVVSAALIIAHGAAQIGGEAPLLLDRIDQMIVQTGRMLGLQRPLHLATLVGEIDVPAVLGKVAGILGGLVSSLLLTITYFAFLLAGRSAARQKLRACSGRSDWSVEVDAAVTHISNDVETYIWVQTVTGLMIAGGAGLAMFAVGLPNVLFWTIVLFLLCYIPMLGVTVGSILPALFALLEFPSSWQGAFVFIAIQAIAFVVGNFIYPRMQAETQNIDPVATLLSLAIWGSLWGLAGAFLAVPMTLMIMMICAYFPQTRWIAVLLSNDGRPVWPGSDRLSRQSGERGSK